MSSDESPAVVELPDDELAAAARAVERAVGGQLAHWPHDPERYFRFAAEDVLRGVEPLIAARVRAEAVAGEGQRLTALIRNAFVTDHETLLDSYWNNGLRQALLIIGAGSVPVATPDEFGAFSDSPQLAAVRAAIEGLPVGTEGQTLTRAFAEGIAVVACRALLGPVAAQLQPGRVGFGTDAFEVGGSLHGQPVATPTEPAIPARLMSLEAPDDAEADERGIDGLLATFDVPAGNAWPAGEYSILAPASPVPAEQPSAAEQALAARAEQALAQRVLDAHDDGLGTRHGVAYRAMVADHWRLIETFEPHRTGARAAFDRRAGEEEATAELLGHRLAVSESAEQPEER